jgi:two-component system sensor histidine kinase TctE
LVHTEGPIEVFIQGPTLLIKDQGPGLSDAVLGRLGQPFVRNSSASNQGHGLGLAWVISICKLYNWPYQFKNRSEGGLEIQIHFPPE